MKLKQSTDLKPRKIKKRSPAWLQASACSVAQLSPSSCGSGQRTFLIMVSGLGFQSLCCIITLTHDSSSFCSVHGECNVAFVSSFSLSCSSWVAVQRQWGWWCGGQASGHHSEVLHSGLAGNNRNYGPRFVSGTFQDLNGFHCATKREDNGKLNFVGTNLVLGTGHLSNWVGWDY